MATFARQAENRLDRLEAATSLQDLAALPGNAQETFSLVVLGRSALDEVATDRSLSGYGPPL